MDSTCNGKLKLLQQQIKKLSAGAAAEHQSKQTADWYKINNAAAINQLMQ